VLEYGKSGVLTDVRKPEAIAEAMERLARNEDHRMRVAQSGLNRAQTHYRLEAVFRQYQDLYLDVLRG
jgi:glycosyltransferase involved in cell wall biosynthesis